MKKLIPDEKNWKDKLSRFFNNKGFYVILVVCIIAVAATAIFVTTRNMNVSEGDLDNDKIVTGEANVDGDDTAKEVAGSINKGGDVSPSTASDTPAKPSAATPDNSAPKDNQKGSTTPKATATIAFERPVDGPVMKDFTKDINTFSESKTMGDFRAHKGIDFKVDKLTKVRAVAAGTISLVEDNESGITVEISHGTDGLVTRYAGLSKQGLEDISYGMKVKANDIIGLIGDPIQSECEDGPHLHFEVLKNGKSIDPSTYLKSTSTTEDKK